MESKRTILSPVRDFSKIAQRFIAGFQRTTAMSPQGTEEDQLQHACSPELSCRLKCYASSWIAIVLYRFKHRSKSPTLPQQFSRRHELHEFSRIKATPSSFFAGLPSTHPFAPLSKRDLPRFHSGKFVLIRVIRV